MPDWPVPDAILADFRELLEAEGSTLELRSDDDLRAGFARAELAHQYTPDLDEFDLAALMFEAIATRHPLVDGNKRLAFQAAADFLELNAIDFDAPAEDVAHLCIAVVAHERPVGELAAFLRQHSRKVTLEDFL